MKATPRRSAFWLTVMSARGMFSSTCTPEQRHECCDNDSAEDKTMLLISRRWGITSAVDRILVFDDGRIVEDGSHEQLMKLDGVYAKLYRAQAEWYR